MDKDPELLALPENEFCDTIAILPELPIEEFPRPLDRCFCPFCSFESDCAKQLANHIVMCHGENFDYESVEQNRTKNRFRYSDYPGFEQVVSSIMDEAEKRNIILSKGFIRNIALELAGQFGIQNFKATNVWLEGFEKRQGKSLGDGRKLRRNRPKISKFVRLTFGEKHEIATFMLENPGKSQIEYAKIFTEKLNRNVTCR